MKQTLFFKAFIVGVVALILGACGGSGSTEPTTSVPLKNTVPETTTVAVETTTTTIEKASPPTTITLTGSDPAALPPMPKNIEGYIPFEGLRSETFQISDTDRYGTPVAFHGQMNQCGSAFWVARWRSLNPVVYLAAGRLPYDADTRYYSVSNIDPTYPSTNGYLTGYICERPVLQWGDSSSGANLVDVTIEWQLYVLDTSVDVGVATGGRQIKCPSFRSNEELPLAPCDQGYGVLRAQQALVEAGFFVDADGYFGQETYDAVVNYQNENGLESDGYIGPITWKQLLPLLAGYDINDNGVIDPNEIGD